MELPKGFGLYDYLTKIFERATQELDSAQEIFKELDPYQSYMSEQEIEVIKHNFKGLQQAKKSIRNPIDD